MARHPRWVTRFLSEADLETVRRAVAAAERRTSAEIRVHLDHRCPGDPLSRAVALFEQLGMHRTADRNGVMIYVAVADRRLAVIGDEGIHERVGDAYWQRLVATTLAELRAQRPLDGLTAAIRDVGEALRTHFPREPGDTNELSDEVSVG
jgi:uncharacterized membrane protein